MQAHARDAQPIIAGGRARTACVPMSNGSPIGSSPATRTAPRPPGAARRSSARRARAASRCSSARPRTHADHEQAPSPPRPGRRRSASCAACGRSAPPARPREPARAWIGRPSSTARRSLGQRLGSLVPLRGSLARQVRMTVSRSRGRPGRICLRPRRLFGQDLGDHAHAAWPTRRAGRPVASS